MLEGKESNWGWQCSKNELEEDIRRKDHCKASALQILPNSFDSPRIATTVASCSSSDTSKAYIGLPHTSNTKRNKEIQRHAHSSPRTPDERQPDTGNIVILVANGRTEVAKLMLQSQEAFEGSLPTSTS